MCKITAEASIKPFGCIVSSKIHVQTECNFLNLGGCPGATDDLRVCERHQAVCTLQEYLVTTARVSRIGASCCP